MDCNYFKNKYLVNSSRLPGQDYSADGHYFFTVCIKDRKCLLGQVKNGIMGLSKIGCLVYKYWSALPEHYPSCILDEIIINSMDVIELIAVLSNKYKIKVEPKEMNNIKTVGDLINYIEKNKGNKKSIKLDNTF